VNFKDKELTAFSSMLINYGLYQLTRKILTDFPQVWVLFAKLVAQSTPQFIAASVTCHFNEDTAYNHITTFHRDFTRTKFQTDH
jgi:hypothetical protein